MAVTAMDSSKRRVVFGLNVAVNVVLAFVVLGFAIWAAGRFGGNLDLTSARLNSLSPRTEALLGGLDANVSLTGLYSTALKEIRPFAEKHKQQVSDLLELYEGAGRGKVITQMIDSSESPTKVNDLLKALAEKPAYKDEAAPHAEALAAFPALNAKLVELLQAETAELGRLAAADPALPEVPQYAIIERNYELMAQNAQQTETDVKTLQTDEIPQYGTAADLVTDYLKNAKDVLQDAASWMSANGKNAPGINAETSAFFAGAADRCAPLLVEIAAMLETTEGLEPVELEDLHNQLKRGETVLVETAEKAMVLSYDEVWPWRTDQNVPPPPDGDPRDFAGEQAISSTILKLTQTEKTAIVFTRFGGTPLLTAPPPPPGNPFVRPPQAPYQGLKELLDKENLIAEEWDVKTQETPPAIEDAGRTIYVVFPPEPPPQANPMQPAQQPPISAEQKQRIYDAVNASGMAVFLAPWSPPQMQFMPAGKYEFKDYLQTNWGVEVKDSHLALPFTVNPQEEGLMLPAAAARSLLLDSKTFRLTDHPIGRPLHGMPASFQAASPLAIVTGADMPEGVTVEPVVEVKDTEDVWAITNLNRINEDLKKHRGTRRYEDDIAAPFPLAVAATKGDGKKLVVFASDSFVSDAVVNMAPAGSGQRCAASGQTLSRQCRSLHQRTALADRECRPHRSRAEAW